MMLCLGLSLRSGRRLRRSRGGGRFAGICEELWGSYIVGWVIMGHQIGSIGGK